MRKITNINTDWLFVKENVGIQNLDSASFEKVDVPHNWNYIDGQDGGADYYKGACWYKKELVIDGIEEGQKVYLEFCGVNAVSDIYFNGEKLFHHIGGYSKFRVDVTGHIKEKNVIAVMASNEDDDSIYPQKADFTFYGGIYRDVNLLVVEKNHFDLDFYGSIGAKIDTKVEGNKGVLDVEPYVVGEGEVKVSLFDNGKLVKEGGIHQEIENVHLWNGLKDPHLYEIHIELYNEGTKVDEIVKNIGFRTFRIDPKEGFFLNGNKYPLRGVCRHQDFKYIGNSLTKKHHEDDLAMIREMGANTIRLAHYQHDDYVYDLCDKYGFVIWAEIPYISRHMDEANANAEEQMRELIYQNYQHPSIVVWGTSNEITMFKGHQKGLVKENKVLHELCHTIDPTRLTTLACFAMCGPFNPVTSVTDVVSWNFYFGWYVPFMWLNNVWFDLFHFLRPKRIVGISEYGADAMPHLHSEHPRRGDSTEDYQTRLHEYMAKFLEKRDYMWASHVWNMFDFGSDGRNQGGEPGVNHKGLVTFDRKIKKDSFYVYKAYWSDQKFVHIAEKRFANRAKSKLTIHVYSNLDEVSLYVNDKLVATQNGHKRHFKFRVPLKGTIKVKAVSGEFSDEATFNRVDKFDQNYKLHAKSNNYSWEK